MPIGPYSPCPGGNDNKVKFCCSTLVGELQKIERMLEGEQFLACLKHIEHLEKTHPDKACLLATKSTVLRVLERYDEARATVARFREKHPENPIALAESAIQAAMDGENRQGVESLLRALTASGSQMHPRVYHSMTSLARLLATRGQLPAARAVAMLQSGIETDDHAPLSFVMRLNASPSIPLLMKEDRILDDCPDGVSWRAEFDEARSLALKARWTEAAERLANLAERVDREPVIWRNLATLLGWLADTPGTIGALRKFAALDVPLEDAVEAEALALLLSDNPLGDLVDVLTLRYTVREVEPLEAALSASPRAVKANVDLASMATEESPPPRNVFLLFDRPAPEPDAEITAETTPKMLCQAYLYGRQTDRDAELEVTDVSAPDLDGVKALVAESAGDALDPEPRQEVSEQTSATQRLLTFNWRLPAHASPEDVKRITQEHVDEIMLQTWPKLPLGLLGGKCPQEVADQEAGRVRLLAAIMVLDFWTGQDSRFDFNRLRSELGLPTLEPIDPEKTPLEGLPRVRWSRLVAEKLSDDELVDAYRRAMAYSARSALETLGRAMIRRTTLAGREERLLAFEMMAGMTEDSGQRLQYIDEGRNEAKQAGGSCARWDLMELPARLERGESREASQLLNHLQSRHINEPGVARALTGLLVEIGILNPDGTPAVRQGTPAAEEPSLVAPGEQADDPGKLWTPESQTPTGEKPNIWTPGSD